MKCNKLVSVIIPVYNTEMYISRCLDSIINNTYELLEIICINDGSVDNSLSVLKEFEKNDKRIKVIDSPNKGVSHARNLGLREAKGDYIAFVDSDDWIHHQYFEILLFFAEKNDIDIVSCRFSRKSCTDNELELEKNKLTGELLKSNELLDNSILKSYVWGKIYTKKSISGCVFDEELSIAEDKAFNITVFTLHSDINAFIIDYSLYNYFYRNNSALNNMSGVDFLNLGKKYIELIDESSDPRYQMIMLNEAFINTITGRYLTMFIEDEELKSRTQDQINKCLSLEKEIKPFGFMRSYRLRLMARYPIVYRLYRLSSDHTMINWEKQQKRNRI